MNERRSGAFRHPISVPFLLGRGLDRSIFRKSGNRLSSSKMRRRKEGSAATECKMTKLNKWLAVLIVVLGTVVFLGFTQPGRSVLRTLGLTTACVGANC